MSYLVLGGTGNVGSNVVRELLARGQHVRVLSREPQKAQRLGSVEIRKGDLLDPDTLADLYDGVEGVFVLVPMSPTEANAGLMAVSAAMNAGVKRLVYLSVQQVDRAPFLPHFGCKVGIEAGVRASGTEWTILRPSNFYQNDYRYRDAMLQHGVYPQPLGGIGVSRVDVRDVAELAALALTQKGHERQTYEMGGPRALTGAQIAEVWSQALDRKIVYAGDDLEAWEKQTLAFMPAWAVYDLKLMYRYFQRQGLRASSDEIAAVTRALGHAPRPFEDFAVETAGVWAREGAKVAG